MLDHDKVRAWILDQFDFEPHSPAAQLAYFLLIIRGGNSPESVIARDYAEWCRDNGNPTKTRVRKWLHDNAIQVSIGLACFTNRHDWKARLNELSVEPSKLTSDT